MTFKGGRQTINSNAASVILLFSGLREEKFLFLEREQRLVMTPLDYSRSQVSAENGSGNSRRPALDKIFLCRRTAHIPSRVIKPRYERHSGVEPRSQQSFITAPRLDIASMDLHLIFRTLVISHNAFRTSYRGPPRPPCVKMPGSQLGEILSLSMGHRWCGLG